MSHSRSFIGGIITVLCVASSCGADGADPRAETARAEADGAGSFDPTSGQDTAAGDEAETDTQAAEGACANEADIELIESGAVDEHANSCGMQCVLNGIDCTTACMSEATGVSEECAGCYAQMIACSAQNCATLCFADSEGEACRGCVDENCNADFEVCTGLE